MTQSVFQIQLKLEIQKCYFSNIAVHLNTVCFQFSLQLFYLESTYLCICMRNEEKLLGGKISKFSVALSPKSFLFYFLIEKWYKEKWILKKNFGNSN